MKRFAILCMVFTMVSINLFAQYNQFRDADAYREKEYRNMRLHKIKEAEEYFYTDTNTTRSYYRCNFYYDTHGRVLKIIYHHHISSENPDSPSVVYVYNKRGKLLSVEKKYFYHQLTTYIYNARGKLIKEKFDTNIPSDNTNGYHSYTICNKYNKAGNVAEQIKLGPDSAVIWKKLFTYSKRKSIVKCIIQTNTGFTRDIYSYRKQGHKLIKMVKTYNADTLTIVHGYVYNKRREQTKGYEIRNGISRIVWDYVYNADGLVITSTGGPASTEDIGGDDLRKDGLTPISYFYNTEGLLTRLTKTIKYPNMDKPTVSVERIIYKTY
jgi:hypothetical protein